jgi:Amino acid synthesis
MRQLEICRLVAHCCSAVADPGAGIARPARKAWAAALVAVGGPLGRDGSLEPFVAVGEELGSRLGQMALDALGPAAVPSAYGKSAIVGAALDVELGAAILHPKLGKPLRALLGGGKALIPSTLKKGGPGARIDVPLHGKDDEWDFALLDSIEASIGGAPGDNEIAVFVALASGGRANARIGRS